MSKVEREQIEKEQEEFVGDPQRESFLFTLLRKVAARKNPPEKEKEEETPQEELPLPPPVSYSKTPAPERLLEYWNRWNQENGGQEQPRSLVESFLGDSAPDDGMLKTIFAALEKEARVAIESYDRLMGFYEEQLRKWEENPPANGEDRRPAPPMLDGEAVIFPTKDWCCAWCMVLPPLGKGAFVDEQALHKQLERQGICFGVVQENVKRLTQPENVCRLMRVAVGIPPIPGEDGKVIEHFPHDIGSRYLVENEKGTVDFKDLHWLVPIEEGTRICDLVEPTKGMDGTDIRKRRLTAAAGKMPHLPMGENVVFNEDKTALVSKVRGQILYENGRYSVKSMIIIPGNVDLSTGNLDVKGSLLIRGNVIAGFSVRASGDITIQGYAEAAQISSEGSITVCQGMVGNMVGSLVAGKDIYCKYLENVRVYAGGELHADSIVNCDVSCEGGVYVLSGRGTIIGGSVSTMRGVFARIIGNKAGRTTVLNICPTEQFLLCKNQLEKDLEVARHEVRLLDLNQREEQSAEKSGLETAILRMKEQKLAKRMEELVSREKQVIAGQIQAEAVYPIVQVSINGVSKALTQPLRACRLYLDFPANTIVIGQKMI